jgi:fibronectin-binding autotransporter adhesin
MSSTETPIFAIKRLATALILASVTLAPTVAWATDFQVNSDAGLRAALNPSTGAQSGDTITFTGNVVLLGDLPVVQNSVTFVGNGNTLSGNGQYRGLFVYSGTVQINNLTLANNRAQGGFGGATAANDNAMAGGGGAGFGGALFVAAGANVTVTNGSFTNNQANGGAGGNSITNPTTSTGAGGGGMGGNGGGMGGGGLGIGANGGSLGSSPIGSPGIALSLASGGAGAGNYAGSGAGGASGGASGGGGGAGADNTSSGGGGGIGGSAAVLFGGGGAGGFGGGGGSSANNQLVIATAEPGGGGGFGGGGGAGFNANGGAGGFGGGGGAVAAGSATNSPPAAGAGGFGGGSAGSYGASVGGGGAGMGGAIFVQSGGSLTVTGTLTFNGNSVTGGTGATAGSAFGSGIFLQGSNGTLGFAPGEGQTQFVSDDIADQSGVGGTGSNAGSYTLNKSGAGTLVLTGANAYSGGTTVTTGTLQVGIGGTSGTLGPGNITDNGALVFNRSDSVSVSGIITGTGTVTQAGSGTLTLTGDNTFSGGAIVAAGTLQVGAGGTSGALGTGNVTNNAALVFNRSDNLTVGGAIVGSGSLTQASNGRLSLTGANTYSGGTTVAAGTLQIGTGGTSGALGTGNVTNNAALVFNRSDNLTVGGAISGSGSLTQAGNGTLSLTGANTYSGGTTVAGGLINFSSNSSLGTAGISLDGGGLQWAPGNTTDISSRLAALGANGGTFDTNGNNVSFATGLSGAGGLVKQGAGTLTLTAASSYSGGTTVNGGMLKLAGGSGQGLLAAGSSLTINGGTLYLSASNQTVGALSGTGGTVTLDSSVLTISGAASAPLAANITGSGGLVVQGGSTFVLAGTNSYTGGTTVSAGSTLQSNANSLQGDITNNGIVIFNQATSRYDGTMSGMGSLKATGSGTAVTLTGNNTYSGGTAIAGTGFGGNSTIINFTSAANFGTGAITVDNGGLQWATGNTTDISSRLAFSSAAINSIIDTNGNNVTFATGLSSSGTLEKRGPGTLILTGDNTFSQTTLMGGTLQIGNGGTIGSIQSPYVVQGGSFGPVGLVFNHSGNTNYSGNTISVSSFGLLGGGSLNLNLSGLYSSLGAVTISSGTLSISGSGIETDDIVNNGTLVVEGNGTFGAISGSGSLMFAGGGIANLVGNNSFTGGMSVANDVVILTGDNTNAGGTTIANTGTLQIGNAGTSGSIAGNITNNGTLTFSRSDNVSFSGMVSGSGQVVKAGSGALTLTGNHTYTGPTTVSGGLINFNSASNFGANKAPGSITLNGGGLQWATGNTLDISPRLAALGANGATFDTNGNNVTLATALGGVGGLVKQGTGTLTLAGNNTFSGGATVAGGLINFSSNSSLGTAGISLNGGGLQWAPGNTTDISSRLAALGANGGTFDTNGNNVSFATGLSGVGGLVKQGAGSLILTGANTYLGSSVIASGSTLQLGTGGTSGTLGSGAVVNNGTLIFDRSDSVTVANTISGAGNLVQSGAGTTILSGNNVYSGTTTISQGGTLQLGDGGASGTLGTGAVTNNGTLNLNRSDSVTVSNGIGGTGNLNLSGGGTTILTGTNSFTAVTVNQGANLQIGNSNTVGSLSGTVIDNGTVIFNQSTAGTFAGLIAGSGNLTKQGAGQLNLTGQVVLATGTVDIQQGPVAINGSLTAKDVNVGSAGTLGGSGTITANVTHAGLTAPGNSIGSLSIVGNYTHSGTHEAEVNSAGATDEIHVTGTANMSGRVQVVAAPGTYPTSSTYTIINASGGVTGAYQSVISNYPFLLPALSYDAQNVYLTLKIGGFSAVAQTLNTAAVASVLDSTVADATGDFAEVLGSLATASVGQGRAALTALSGQSYSGLSTAMINGTQLFLSNFSAKVSDGTQRQNCTELTENCGAWARIIRARGDIGGNANSGDLSYNVVGLATGVDRQLAQDFRLGLAIGHQTGTNSIEGFNDAGRSDTFQSGIYSNYAHGKFYADAIVGYAHTSNSMLRSIAVPGVATRSAKGEVDANHVFGQVEAGYRFGPNETLDAFVTPFVRLQAARIKQNGFSETGAGSLELTVAPQTTESLRSVIGAQTGASFDLGQREKLRLQFGVGWAREHADIARPVTAALAGARATEFTTYGASRNRDEVIFNFSANTAIGTNTSIFLDYQTTRSARHMLSEFDVGVRATW